MTQHDGTPNTGPVDLLHLLKRRRSSFQRWCDENEVHTQEQFQVLAAKVAAQGEFFISDEMRALATQELPKEAPVVQPVAKVEPEPEPEEEGEEAPKKPTSSRKGKLVPSP